jgi:hypothetical protein
VKGGKTVAKAYKLVAEVGEGGKVELTLPLAPGAKIAVVVLTEQEEGFADLWEGATPAADSRDDPGDDAMRLLLHKLANRF